MPFKKVGPDQYVGPSGRRFDYRQVKLYYARGGSFPGQKHRKDKSKPMSYAQGGPVIRPRGRK